MDKKTTKPLEHPWLNEKPQQEKKTSSSPVVVPQIPKGAPQEQDVFDMATELKNAIRDDRIHRSNQTKRNS